ncbi:MAG: hypothetical protein IT378_16185 [Sandaracinaceae bacterium]|nr:hypothetical protein [Sandaracinaceae bacterium]
MKLFLELSPVRRANVWLDEAPAADFTPSFTVSETLEPRFAATAVRRVAGVEINIDHGPRASYGLLGAELVDAEVDGLEVVVSLNNVGFPLRPSLALQPDEVTIGLLEEYAPAVIAGVQRAIESGGVPSKASLRFRWAAHGLVGSSPSIFERIGAIVVRLLTMPKDVKEADLRLLLERA